MHTLLGDFRFALRQLRRAPTFALAAIVCLTLGIGANTAIFTVINAVLVRPLPYPDPDRLMMVWEANRDREGDRNVVSPANYLDWLVQNRAFESTAAVYHTQMNLTGRGEPLEVPVELATAGLFPLLGMRPLLGRTFTAEEDLPGGPPVVVLSHGLWQRRFGGAPEVVGQKVALDGAAVTVVGVLPEGAGIVGVPRAPDLWVPLALDPAHDYRATHGRFLQVFGRLRPGVSRDRAQAEMATIARRLEEAHPENNRGWSVNLVPVPEQVTGTLRRPLLVLAGVVALVLLIACANVANLQLAQAASRRREIAVRAALGASRSRLVRQFLAESVLLAAAGGVGGVLLALWLTDALAARAAETVPRLSGIQVDFVTLAFTVALAAFSGVMFGLVPALHAGRVDLHESLKHGGRGTSGGGARTRAGLVTAQVALSLVLLVGAGLLLKSFARLQEVELGFDPDRVLTARVSLPEARYEDPAAQAAFFGALISEVHALPGVRAAGAINWLPLSGLRSGSGVFLAGRPLPAPGEDLPSDIGAVDPGYFQAMGIPLKAGRLLTSADGAQRPKAVLVSEAFVRRYLPDVPPLGQRIGMEWNDTLVGTIVGVVGDVKHTGVDSLSNPTLYWAIAQFPWSAMSLVVRTTGNPEHLAAAVTARVHALDPELAVADVKPLDAYLGDSLARRRFSMTLLAGFAGLALVLTAVGLYGVMANSVVQRTRELGIRLALGETREALLRGVLLRGLGIAAAGIAIGLAGAVAFTRVLGALLYEVSATDPAVFAGIVALLSIVALLASYLPALRATRVDPMVALRSE